MKKHEKISRPFLCAIAIKEAGNQVLAPLLG
jgi:hypothetical protein